MSAEAAEAAKAARILALEEQGHPRISAILIADTEAAAATAAATAAREIARLRCELVTQIMMERYWRSSSNRTCRMEAIHSFDSRSHSF
jgi:hypothetical protein